MKECLFDISSTIKNFGIDANGLLTCSEADFGKTHNPYVNLTKMAHDDDRIQANVSVVNDVKEQLECEPWFKEAQAKGKIASDFTDKKKPQNLAVGGFSKDEILKAAYVAQTIRFSERSYEYISTIIKSRIDGNSKEVYGKILDEIVKDMPKFEHPALQAYDPESAERMKRAQKAKYAEYIQAFNRRFYNVYSKIKDKHFSAVVDKNTLLTLMSERDLEFLETTAMQNKIKKRGAFDVNEFVLKALLKMRERQQH